MRIYSKNRHPLCLILLLIATLTAEGCVHTTDSRETAKDFLSESAIREDLKLLTDKIEKGVPYPFNHCSREAYDTLKVHIQKSITDSMSIKDVYLLFYPLVQSLQDGHFALYPDNASDNALYFPYKVIIHQNRIYVDTSLSVEWPAEKGTEIVAINNIPSETIISTIKGAASGQKEQQLFFEYWTEKVFHNRLYYLFDMQDTFHIRTPHTSFTTPGVPLQKLVSETEKQLHTGLLNDVAYIKVHDLRLVSDVQRDGFRNQLEVFFDSLRHKSVNKLIIDIRGNMGGSSVLAKDILDFISPGAYTLSIGSDYFDKGTKKYYKNEALHHPAAPGIHAYNGHVVLLSDVLTYSSAHMMQAGFKYFRMGTTIGNGSSESLHITGEIRKTTLKNSQFELVAPTVNFRLPGYNEAPTGTFTPDILIYETLTDRLQKKDPILAKALEYLNEQ